MNRLRSLPALLLLLLPLAFSAGIRAQDAPTLPSRVIPPFGEKISGADRASLSRNLQDLSKRLTALPHEPGHANVAIFLKAVRYALDHHEFYKTGDVRKARTLLAEADRRLTQLEAGQAPWLTATGFVVRGYYSTIDGSPQPFGLEIPEGTPATHAPAWIWLQGRGESRTDLHFIAERMQKGGDFSPPGTIIVHAWGRYCMGYKGPGEQDVRDVRQLLIDENRINPARTAIAGFSMGGAGAWLLGAHYPDHWAAVHTGAGFVDVQRYQKLEGARLTALPSWEKTLWGQNDIPDYTRNLLNLPVISYSGEKDTQRASAEIMAEEFQKHGAALTHYIGPGMGHKYHPESLQKIQAEMQKVLLQPDPPAAPLKISFQTKTLDYSRAWWLQLTGLREHWKDTRVEAVIDAQPPGTRHLTLTTTNTNSLRFDPPRHPSLPHPLTVQIDGQTLKAPAGRPVELQYDAGKWKLAPPPPGLRKKPDLQGPIDDAFNAPFLHVLPDKAGFHPATDAWVTTEIAAQLSRWRTLFRGDARHKPASSITPEDRRLYHLILWGDPASNPLIGEFLPELPVQWTVNQISMNGKSWPAAGHLPVLIHPSPAGHDRYIVLNSGPTWREAHSKTNSQQNPKLPDWALLDISDPPTPEAAGKVQDAGFFNEKWEWK